MAWIGTHLRDTWSALQTPARRQLTKPSVTPPGLWIADLVDIIIAVVIGGMFARGLDVWVRWLGGDQMSATFAGALWATATALISGLIHGQFQRGRQRLSVAKYVAPYIGHRIYRTYRLIRYGHS